jgi:hypothetical protein
MRRLLLIGSAVVASASANAQINQASITIYGGLTVATLHGDSVPGPLHTSGFVGGAAVAWPLTNHVSLQPELQFVQKGDDETDTFSGGIFSEHIRLNYVEVPVLLRLSASSERGVTPFFVGGPQIAFKTSCSIDVHGLPGNYTCADLPHAESMDWGVIAGVGTDVAVMGHALSLSARYDWGLRDAFKDNQAKTRTLVVLLGWRVH